MDLTLRVAADFKEASKAFNDLANSSDATREKIEKFSSSFQEKNIDSFIDKQKLLTASLTGTRGEVAAMQSASGNYQKEIERLIRSGLDPESDAIRKLRDEQEKLKSKIQETNDVQKAQADLMKTAEVAAVACYAAISACIAALATTTQKTAEMGDQFAKTARVIGMTAETFQELDYAAKMSGVDNLKGSLEKLNKTVADVKSGTGALTSYLKDNDQQLLNQLQNVNSNEEAFNLMMDAINRAPDEFSRAELAQAAFGKSGQQLILLANEGADGIANLREEARKYGVISNEAAANSEAYLDAQARLKTALAGVATELTSGLMPGLTETITKIADFIASIDDWEGALTTAGYVLAGVTAGLTAFLVISKGAAVIDLVSKAFRGLTAAIATNPIGAIAVVVTAVLIPALIALYRNWDTVQTYLQQGVARLEFAFKWFGSVIKEGLVVAFNTVKSAAVTLVDFIYGNIIRAVGNMLEVMGRLPFVGDLFLAAADKVKGLGNAIGNLAEETRRASDEAIQAAHDEQNATEEALRSKLSSIDEAARARRTELEERRAQIAEEQQLTTEAAEAEYERLAEQEEEKKELLTKSLSDRLALLGETEAQAENERQEQFTSWMMARLEAEELDFEQRIAFLEVQRAYVLEMENLTYEERLSAREAFSKKINELEEAELAASKERLREKLKITQDTLASLSNFMKNFAKESVAAAIASKALASAEAAINSYLAFDKALAAGVPPWNYIAAAGVLAAGLAKQAQIIATSIPSAETGGRFVVPQSVGSDSSYMRVNSGEEIEVTPRGMTGFSGSQSITVQIEKQTIFDVVNDGIRSGDVLIMATNY